MKKVFKRVFLVLLAGVMMVGIAVSMTSCGSSKVDFQKVFDEYCSSIWADVGSDGSYLTIDTNPFNRDDTGIAYSEAATAIEEVNEALGLPESLYNDMSTTTALMGRQSEDYSDVGITVSWSYHPDKGLEVTYKLSD